MHIIYAVTRDLLYHACDIRLKSIVFMVGEVEAQTGSLSYPWSHSQLVVRQGTSVFETIRPIVPEPSSLSSVCLQVLVPWIPGKASARIMSKSSTTTRKKELAKSSILGTVGAMPTSLKPEKNV